jgi:hypothetical protein
MNNFYRFTEDDFEEIPLSDLKVGDKLSWGVGSPRDEYYGAVAIEDIAETDGGFIVFFNLPVGAEVFSGERCTVNVEWEGEQPQIRVVWFFDYKSDATRLVQRG